MKIKYTFMPEVADINWGNTSITKASYTQDGYVAYSAAGPDGKIDKFEYDCNGVVLSAIGANCGKCFYAEGKWIAIKNTITIIPKKGVIDAKFLYYYLNRKGVWSIRGGGQPFITLATSNKIRIPLLPLKDQIRIAEILTRAEKLIAKRKESIKALDEFLKSTFLAMFGLDNANYKKWDIEPLSVNTEIVSGVTKGKKYKTDLFREVPYMRVANVQDGHLNLAEIKTIEVTESEIHQYKLMKGDLLLTEGGDPDKLGRGAVWNNEIDECIHQNHIFRVRVKDDTINPVFLSALMASKYGKSYFLRAAKQTTGIASINSTQLKAFPLIKPPVGLQNKFAAIVEKVEAMKVKYNESLVEMEKLYGSLSQRAFRGEL